MSSTKSNGESNIKAGLHVSPKAEIFQIQIVHQMERFHCTVFGKHAHFINSLNNFLRKNRNILKFSVAPHSGGNL